jgi:hypothetical protein
VGYKVRPCLQKQKRGKLYIHTSFYIIFRAGPEGQFSVSIWSHQELFFFFFNYSIYHGSDGLRAECDRWRFLCTAGKARLAHTLGSHEIQETLLFPLPFFPLQPLPSPLWVAWHRPNPPASKIDFLHFQLQI